MRESTKDECKEKGRSRRNKRKPKSNADRKDAGKNTFVSKAKELASNLVTTEAYVASFDCCEAVSQRRIHIKKLCHGRVNTICADVRKVQLVSKEIVDALKAEKKRDDDFRERLIKKDPVAREEMSRGRDYFITLLAREVRVRIEAEGFNGPRGDGFPLAAFVSTVASEIPGFIPTMEAYIYDACPLALPVHLGKEASKEDFSDSLGMKKNKDGTYESFERFLQRTEGLISFMANVMSSHPADHTLFGGHKGAILWLERFLGQLLKEPGQLPLFVAPVLHAFLTGAGHMLANLHAEEFDKFVKIILDDVILRLDEGPIGAPSVHRLRECIETGLEGFEANQPLKALSALYNNGKEAAPPPPPPHLIFHPQYGETQPEPICRAQSYGFTQQFPDNQTFYGFAPSSLIRAESYGGESYGAQSYSGELYGAQSYGAQSYGAQSYGTQSYGPQSYGIRSYGVQSYGEQSYGEQSYGEQSYGEQSHGCAPSPVRRPRLGSLPTPVGRSRRILTASSRNKPSSSL